MCFSAAAHFVGSTVLGAVGVATLTNEGFVWLGLDGILSPVVTHNMGAAFMQYA